MSRSKHSTATTGIVTGITLEALGNKKKASKTPAFS